MSLKALHDQLLEEKPDDASHVAAECPFCANEQTINEPIGGRMSDPKTYSEDEVQALVQAKVSEAIAPISAQLSEYKANEDAQAVEAKIAAAQAEADEKVKDLQAQLDAAVIEAEAATTARVELETYLQSAKEEEEREAEANARKEVRTAQITELACFSEEYVAANADRWAGMSDEDFEAALADYKVQSEKASAGNGSGNGIPSGTALHASRDGDLTGEKFAATREVFRFRESGVDPRELTR